MMRVAIAPYKPKTYTPSIYPTIAIPVLMDGTIENIS